MTKITQAYRRALTMGLIAAAFVVPSSIAFAQPKPLLALSEIDRLAIEYQFSSGVKWCFEKWTMTLANPAVAKTVTLDLNVQAGTITFEDKANSRKVVCEPQGVRTIFDGVEKFTEF